MRSRRALEAGGQTSHTLKTTQPSGCPNLWRAELRVLLAPLFKLGKVVLKHCLTAL